MPTLLAGAHPRDLDRGDAGGRILERDDCIATGVAGGWPERVGLLRAVRVCLDWRLAGGRDVDVVELVRAIDRVALVEVGPGDERPGFREQRARGVGEVFDVRWLAVRVERSGEGLAAVVGAPAEHVPVVATEVGPGSQHVRAADGERR